MVSHHLSVRQWEGLRWGFDERVNEKISYCSSTLGDLPVTDKWNGGKVIQEAGEYA